jgi:SAM-dependent methyltransferase
MSSHTLSADNEVTCVRKPENAAEVDETGYFAANPDIRDLGLTARDHFLTHGQAEGRLQFVNAADVIAMREWKIERLRFRSHPSRERKHGAPANFLSEALIAEFGIPDSPPVSAHPYGAGIVQLIHDNPDHLFLDVGAGLRERYYRNVVNTEIYPSVSTDVLCVGENMPFESNLFDHVFCFATLEHTRRPWDVAREICRVLKPGGTAYIDYPFLQPVHGYPHHFFNATPLGNQSLFEQDCDIRSLEIGWHHHPMVGMQWALTVFRNGLNEAEAREFESLRIKDIVNAPLGTLLEQDYCRNLHMNMQRIIASGSMLVAEKRAIASPDLTMPTAHDALPFTPPVQSPGTPPPDFAELEERADQLQQQLHAIHRSTSWRLTAPLRAVGRIFHSS